MNHKYIGKTCPYCQFPLKADSDVVECRACKVPHHRECWVENGGCTTFGCRETTYRSAAEERLEVFFDETPGQETTPARGGGISKLLVALFAMTIVVLTVMIFAYINLLRDRSVVIADPAVSIPPDAEAGQIDEAKRKEIIDFMEKATSNIVAFLPEFTDPNQISNDDLIFILFFNGITTSYWNDEDYITRFKGSDVQKAARLIFGSDIKNIVHSSAGGAIWEDSLQEYHFYAFGPTSFTENHVISVKEEPEGYVVDVVHLRYYYGDYDRLDETDVYDEYDNLVTVLKGNEKISDAKLKDLPIRRYILKKTNEGGFFITQSIKM